MTEVQFGKNRYHEIQSMVDWCYEHFGQGGYLAHPYDRWTLDQAYGHSCFSFKDAADATLFALRWA